MTSVNKKLLSIPDLRLIDDRNKYKWITTATTAATTAAVAASDYNNDVTKKNWRHGLSRKDRGFVRDNDPARVDKGQGHRVYLPASPSFYSDGEVTLERIRRTNQYKKISHINKTHNNNNSSSKNDSYHVNRRSRSSQRNDNGNNNRIKNDNSSKRAYATKTSKTDSHRSDHIDYTTSRKQPDMKFSRSALHTLRTLPDSTIVTITIDYDGFPDIPSKNKNNNNHNNHNSNNNKTPNYGFNIVGSSDVGSEGIYVSNVKAGSEGHARGLRSGDRILAINGISFEDVTSQEAAAVIRSSRRLEMVVERPIKKGRRPPTAARPLYVWVTPKGAMTSPPLSDDDGVGDNGDGNVKRLSSSSLSSSSSVLMKRKFNKIRRVQITTGSRRLGLVIRGGREYKLGIYVTGVTSGSLGEQAGVKVGDQILDVNGHNFLDVDHVMAKKILKSSKELIITLKDVGKIPYGIATENYNNSNDNMNNKRGSDTMDGAVGEMELDVPSRRNWDSLSEKSSFKRGWGSQLVLNTTCTPPMYKWTDPSSLLKRASRLLNEGGYKMFINYLKSYLYSAISIYDLFNGAIILLNSRKKLSLLEDLRHLIRHNDLHIYNKLVVQSGIYHVEPFRDSRVSVSSSIKSMTSQNKLQRTRDDGRWTLLESALNVVFDGDDNNVKNLKVNSVNNSGSEYRKKKKFNHVIHDDDDDDDDDMIDDDDDRIDDADDVLKNQKRKLRISTDLPKNKKLEEYNLLQLLKEQYNQHRHQQQHQRRNLHQRQQQAELVRVNSQPQLLQQQQQPQQSFQQQLQQPTQQPYSQQLNSQQHTEQQQQQNLAEPQQQTQQNRHNLAVNIVETDAFNSLRAIQKSKRATVMNMTAANNPIRSTTTAAATFVNARNMQTAERAATSSSIDATNPSTTISLPPSTTTTSARTDNTKQHINNTPNNIKNENTVAASNHEDGEIAYNVDDDVIVDDNKNDFVTHQDGKGARDDDADMSWLRRRGNWVMLSPEVFMEMRRGGGKSHGVEGKSTTVKKRAKEVKISSSSFSSPITGHNSKSQKQRNEISNKNLLTLMISKTKLILGIAIVGGADTDYIMPRVAEIQENGAAFTSGLREGDVILEVDGTSLLGMYHEECARLIVEKFRDKSRALLEMNVARNIEMDEDYEECLMRERDQARRSNKTVDVNSYFEKLSL
ncbi:hypothetical protein HELRODRAFT_190836 [Helobdella robusta]|uniref:PDZ domain-containing protein n=1 Tax=Helobdella robusta TaxID=6412 RepID=T1FSC5_HELRO|nr:hypothetical protein HELRODRAFT_190836 [Helobdella robusta]ESO07990.1 hypothetical protein HELRODRAFT_190836 [Helobdella robusta]